MTELEKIERYVEARPDDPGAYHDALAVCYGHIAAGETEWHGVNAGFRKRITDAILRMSERRDARIGRMNDLYYQSLLMDARVSLDAYMLYIERTRDPRKQFYMPRRKRLKRVVDALQRLADDETDLLGVSMPPGTGKSGTAIFYLTWMAGKYPDEPILTGSHSNAFVRGVYDECLRIFDRNGEYLWGDVFPDVKVVNTNAKDCRIDLGKRKRFETLEFTSVGSGNAGLYRAGRLLYCDDLVPGLEVALSKERLEKLWQLYTTDLRQRKIGDHCKELHIATRWAVGDVLSRLERQYEDDRRAEFIVLPALDENDESNFDYRFGVGFTTAFFREQREIMDRASFEALYQNHPIEREGLLYAEDELRRFFELPDREPDGIVAVCDTKAKGSDYAFMPIMYLYGRDVYIADCICDNGDPGIVEERLVQALIKHRVQMAQFESNSAGWHIAEKVQNRVRELGGITKITTKQTTANKETKIVTNAPEVKERCLFLDRSRIGNNMDYKRMMAMLTGYTMAGKNKHDDVPDGMAMAMMYLAGVGGARATVFARPF